MNATHAKQPKPKRRGRRLIDDSIVSLARSLEATVNEIGPDAESAGILRMTIIRKLAIEHAEADARRRGEL